MLPSNFQPLRGNFECNLPAGLTDTVSSSKDTAIPIAQFTCRDRLRQTSLRQTPKTLFMLNFKTPLISV